MNWKRMTSLLCALLLAGTACVQPALAASGQETLQTALQAVTGSGTAVMTVSTETAAAGTEASEPAADQSEDQSAEQSTDQSAEQSTDQSAGTRTLQSNYGDISIEQSETQTDTGTWYRRLYTMQQDTSCVMERLVPSAELSGQVEALEIPGSLELVRWLDEETDTWMATAILENVPAEAEVLFIQTDQASAIVYLPAVYESRENEMIEELTSCGTSLTVTEADACVQVSWQAETVPAGAQIELLWVVSSAALVDWNDRTEMEAWKDLLITGDNRWTYDGYYYRTPSTYYPTGENYFHRIPDPYITLKMLDQPDSYGAVVLSICMLDVMLELMNGDGYFPTYALSTWLSEDYGIGAGYFDTRWNADLTIGLLTAWEQYGIEEFFTCAQTSGQFWLSYIPEHSVTFTASSGAVTGLLVEDYWYPDGNQTVHTSLNHQLAEILMLYKLGDSTGDTAYTDLAEQLLNGVRAVGMQWVKSDNDLWYRIDPDGTMTGTDYETLTYDDMYRLQQYLVQSGRGSDTILSALMIYKKSWMDVSGITDYLQ